MKKINNELCEEYVSFKTAKKLVKAGFGIIPKVGLLAILYKKDGEPTTYANYGVYGSGLDGGYVPRPTVQLALKWIWVNFGYHIGVVQTNDEYYWIISRQKDSDVVAQSKNTFDIPWDATVAALEYTLKKLI